MGEYEDKGKGEIKEKVGQMTGDPKTEWEGKGDKAKGKVEEAGRKLGEGMDEKSASLDAERSRENI